MIQTLTLLILLLCSPIAKWEADAGRFEGGSGGVSIEQVHYDADDGELAGVTWASDSPICRVEVKAATEVGFIDYDPPAYEGDALSPNSHAVSYVQFFSEPTSVTLSEASASSIEPVMILIAVVALAALSVGATRRGPKD